MLYVLGSYQVERPATFAGVKSSGITWQMLTGGGTAAPVGGALAAAMGVPAGGAVDPGALILANGPQPGGVVDPATKVRIIAESTLNTMQYPIKTPRKNDCSAITLGVSRPPCGPLTLAF